MLLKAKSKNVILTILGLGLLAYYVDYMLKYFTSDKAFLLFSPAILGMLGLAAITYCSTFFFSAIAWKYLLSIHTTAPRVTVLYGILASTQLAKYIPGNVLQHLARATLSMNRAISAKVFTQSIIQEMSLAVAVGLVVGFPVILSQEVALRWLADSYLIIGLGLVILIVAAQLVCTRILRFNIFFPPLPQPPLLYAIVYLLMGLSIYELALALNIEVGFIYLVSSFALAWVVGFLTLGAPAGLGSREAILVILLTKHITPEEAATLSLAIRLATMLGDGISFFVGTAILRRAHE